MMINHFQVRPHDYVLPIDIIFWILTDPTFHHFYHVQ